VDIVHVFLAFLNDMPGYLTAWTTALGGWSYVALFAVIFCETGLVVTPFLPGDSLLFALGALAAADGAYLDPKILAATLWLAALSGDCVNYSVGRALSGRLQRREGARLINRHHLERTQAFFEKHGGKTIVLARFAPILRTYAPFVAGVGRMRIARFAGFSVAGGGAWIASFLMAGYFFGNVPSIKSNFHLVIVAISAISLAPAIIEFARGRAAARARSRATAGEIASRARSS
jgi:membrane-associated protein